MFIDITVVIELGIWVTLNIIGMRLISIKVIAQVFLQDFGTV